MSVLMFLDKYKNNNSKSNNVCVTTFESPVGKVVASADDQFLYIVSFEDSKKIEKAFDSLFKELKCNFIEEKNKILLQLENELTLYFGGKLKKFTVPLKTFGSEFQKEVWNKLLELPYASTQTYGDLAKAMGRASSHARAIGAACGANAHLLVIPCHRLVASNSSGGFSNGVDRKEWLLQHEKKYS